MKDLVTQLMELLGLSKAQYAPLPPANTVRWISNDYSPTINGWMHRFYVNGVEVTESDYMYVEELFANKQ